MQPRESEIGSLITQFQNKKDIHEMIYKGKNILCIALIEINKTASLIFEDGVQITSPSHLAIVSAQGPHEQAN